VPHRPSYGRAGPPDPATEPDVEVNFDGLGRNAEAALFGTNRRCLKSPVRENRTPGFVGGAAGKPAVLPRRQFAGSRMKEKPLRGAARYEH